MFDNADGVSLGGLRLIRVDHRVPPALADDAGSGLQGESQRDRAAGVNPPMNQHQNKMKEGELGDKEQRHPVVVPRGFKRGAWCA